MTDNKVLAESIRNYLESGVDLLLTDDDYRTIIKALEQEPCEDCISREYAIEGFMHWYSDLLEYHKEEVDFKDILMNMPPVTPHYTEAEIQKMQEMEQTEIQKAYELGKAEQPKTGHWINIDATHSKCDRCGAVFEIASENGEANYCPNCGCRMEGSE